MSSSDRYFGLGPSGGSGTCWGLARYATRSRTSSRVSLSSRPSGIINTGDVWRDSISSLGTTTVSLSVRSVSALSVSCLMSYSPKFWQRGGEK
jgi:hypothetical protein